MRLQYHLPCTTPPFKQRTLAPRRPHDWAEASDAPIMAAMADTAAIMTTSFVMNTPFSLAVKIRPEVFLLFPKGPLSFSGAPDPGHVILMRASNGIYPRARFQWYFE